jgi:hypothetical protein
MYRRWLLAVTVLALGVGTLADGATIVWVSDNKTPANGVPADQAWVDLLTAQGYTVDLSFRDKQARTLDATKIAALTAADLIIISRDTNSGDYDDGTEIADWNGITTPILMQVAHIAGNNRWKWIDTGSNASAQPTMAVVLPGHPIFAGVALGANNQVSILTTNCSFLSTTEVGNGTLLAQRADNEQPWIVEWAPGVEFYAGSGETAGGKRLLFLGGGTSGVSDGTYNYNDVGKMMFLNAVEYLVGREPVATEPGPADGAVDVPRDAVLSWKPALPGLKHDVYLGTSVDDVNAATVSNPLGVLVSAGQDANTFEPAAPFAYGQTCYWRVDEVNATPDATVFRGPVWSFTVEPYTYPLRNVTATASSSQADMGPENAVNGAGLNAQDEHSTDGTQMWLSAGATPNWIQFEFDRLYLLEKMWVWNSNQQVEYIVGFGAKDVTVEYSADGSTWTPLAGVPVFTRADSSPTYAHDTVVDFGGVQAQYVKLTIDSTWGDTPQAGLSEVRFFYVPLRAREPEPAVDAATSGLDVILNWRPGRTAASHEVYLGTDPNQLALIDTVGPHRCDLAERDLGLGRTYSWRVDEVNEAVTPRVWQGDVWRFSTPDYLVVDDFESYNDEENQGTRIYETWLDGWESDENGSQAGYADPPFAERQIVHSGAQSLPLSFDNTGTATYSEAVRTFDAPQDWTAHGIKSLSLYFRGAPDNRGQLYVKINSTRVAYNGDAADIATTAWLPWNIDLSTVGGKLNNVAELTIGVEGSDAQGIVYLDDVRLYPRTPEYYTPTDPGQANLLALYACEGNANDTSGHGLNGTAQQATFVASGRTGGGSAVQVEKAGYLDLGNPASLDFSTGDWAITAWYKTAMTGNTDAEKGTIVGKGGDTAGGKRYALIMSESTSGVVTLVTDDDMTKYVVNSQSVTNDDRWHFVAGQRTGTTLQIYIDGRLEGTATIAEPYDLSGTAQHNAYIGAITNHTDGSLYKLFNGLLDEVRLYNRALSVEEILWLAGKTAPVARPL